VAFDVSPLPRLEHHLWMLEGILSLEIEGTGLRLEKGDCVRYVLSGSSRFVCLGKRSVKYLLAIVHS
jgi:hypothetical protein